MSLRKESVSDKRDGRESEMFNMVLRVHHHPPNPLVDLDHTPSTPLVVLGARSTQRFLGLFPFNSCAVITSAGSYSLSRRQKNHDRPRNRKNWS